MKKILSILKYFLLGGSVLSFATLGFLGEGTSVSFMLIWAYILVGTTLAVSLLLPLYNIIKDPRGAVATVSSLVIVAVVVIVCYLMSDATPVINSGGGIFENTMELRLSDTGLFAAYFTFGVAMIVSVVGEVWNSFK